MLMFYFYDMLFVLLMFVKYFCGSTCPTKYFNIATCKQAHTASTHNCITIVAEAEIIVSHLPPTRASVYRMYYSYSN